MNRIQRKSHGVTFIQCFNLGNNFVYSKLMKIYKFNWTGFTERHIGIAHPFKSEEHILGVKFHSTPWFKPTREFNAEDVLFTFEWMRNPNMPFRKARPVEFINFHQFGLDKIISKIEALDEGHAVRFTLNTVHAPFLFELAAAYASISSAEYATQLLNGGNPSDINWKPVGTGPFIFQEYVKDATIRLKGNPKYWKPNEVQLSKLVFDITPEAAVRAQKLKANECQVMASPRLTDIPAL